MMGNEEGESDHSDSHGHGMMGNNQDQSDHLDKIPGHQAEEQKPKGPGNTEPHSGGGGGKQTGSPGFSGYHGNDYDDMFRRQGNVNTAKGGGVRSGAGMNDRYLLSNYYDYYNDQANGGSPYKDYYYYQEVANQRSRNRNGWNNGRTNQNAGNVNSNGGGRVPQKASAFFGFNDGTDRQWGWVDKTGQRAGGGGQQTKQPSQNGREGGQEVAGQEVAYQPPSQSTNQGARNNQFLPRQRAGLGYGGAQMSAPTRPPGSDHPPPPPGKQGAPKPAAGGGNNKQNKQILPHRPKVQRPGPRKFTQC